MGRVEDYLWILFFFIYYVGFGGYIFVFSSGGYYLLYRFIKFIIYYNFESCRRDYYIFKLLMKKLWLKFFWFFELGFGEVLMYLYGFLDLFLGRYRMNVLVLVVSKKLRCIFLGFGFREFLVRFFFVLSMIFVSD